MANLISMAIEGQYTAGPVVDQARRDLAALRSDAARGIQPPRINTDALKRDIAEMQRLFGVGRSEATKMAQQLQIIRDDAKRARITELLDTSKLSAQTQALNALRDAASGALSQLGSVGRLLAPVAAVAGPVTVLGAALVGVSAASVQVATALAGDVQALENLSRRTGIAIEDVQALQRALTNAGASPDAFIRPLERLNRELAENSDLVKQLGLSGLAPLDALRKLLGVLAASPDVVKRNEVANRLLGQSYGELVGVAQAAGAGFDQSKEQMRAAGLLVTDDMIPATRRLREENQKLGDQWEGVWTRLRRLTVAPATGIVRLLGGVTKGVLDLNQAIAKLALSGALGPLAQQAAILAAASAATSTAPSRKVGFGNPFVTPDGFTEQDLALFRGPDLISGLKLDGGKGEKSARERQIESLQKLLGGARSEAAALADQLARIDRVSQLESLAVKIQKETGNLQQVILDTLPADARQSLLERFVLGPTELPPVSERVKAEMGLIRETLDGFTAASAEAPRGGQTGLGLATALLPPPEQFQQIGAELESIAHATGRGIQAGLTTAFVNLTNQAQTFRGAMVSIFQAMVQEILAALAKLATVALGKLLLNIGTGGGSGFIEAIGRALVGSAATPVSGGAQRLGSAGEFAIQPQQGNTFIIQSIDSRSVLDDLLSPTGSFRRANDRLAELGAVA